MVHIHTAHTHTKIYTCTLTHAHTCIIKQNVTKEDIIVAAVVIVYIACSVTHLVFQSSATRSLCPALLPFIRLPFTHCYTTASTLNVSESPFCRNHGLEAQKTAEMTELELTAPQHKTHQGICLPIFSLFSLNIHFQARIQEKMGYTGIYAKSGLYNGWDKTDPTSKLYLAVVHVLERQCLSYCSKISFLCFQTLCNHSFKI